MVEWTADKSVVQKVVLRVERMGLMMADKMVVASAECLVVKSVELKALGPVVGSVAQRGVS